MQLLMRIRFNLITTIALNNCRIQICLMLIKKGFECTYNYRIGIDIEHAIAHKRDDYQIVFFKSFILPM